MALSQSADIRALLGGGADGDRLATAHFVVGAGFLVIGGLLELLALLSLQFDDIFPLSYGRLEPMANLCLMLGFAVVSLVGGVYYVLPRLTGARLWGADLARVSLLGLSIFTIVGAAIVGLGLGSGRQPLGLPWWMHVPIAFLLFIPAVVTIGTVMDRSEKRSFPTVWFVIGGMIWLPFLYLAYFAGDWPGLGSVAVVTADLFFSAGFITMFVLTVGTGLAYYTVVKEIDVPLASRQLAIAGFWSLGFAGVWWGLAQTVFGPGPSWVAGVAAALGLAFPIGTLANAANLSLTLEGRWELLKEKAGVTSAILGTYLAVVVAAMASFASFPSIGSVTALTGYWKAIEYAALLGVGSLLIAGVSFEALPRAAGRRLPSPERAKSFNRLTIVGAGGVLTTMAAAGLITGYSWLAGSNSAAYIDAGEGWGAGAGVADALTLIALAFAVVTFVGQLAYASVITGTVFSGHAVTQEVLVEVESERE